MKLIHVSDIHLTASGEDLFCANPHERLDQCIAHINHAHGDADLCVVTGDLTHWGEPDAYRQLRAALDIAEVPLALLLGNHDDRANFKEAFPERATDPNGFVQEALEVPVGRFLLMDTKEPGTHAGSYCDQRLEWLSEQLRAGRGTPHFLFMHHPPMPVHVASMDRIGQQDSDALKACLQDHAADIRHIFFGHCHMPMSGSYLGIPFSSIRSINHPLWPDYPSETITIADLAPHYAVVLIDDDAVVIHHEEFAFEGRKWTGIGTSTEAWKPQHSPAK